MGVEVKKMKKDTCDACKVEIEVYKEYEPKWCCDGRECGCMGYPINPIFCDKCEEQILGKVISEQIDQTTQ